MKKDSKKINEKLLIEFPELKGNFEEETSWQDGISTGSIIVYEDVFKRFIEEKIVENDEKTLVRIFKFIEEMMMTNDEYQKNVIEVSILEWLSISDLYDVVEKYLLPITKNRIHKIKTSV